MDKKEFICTLKEYPSLFVALYDRVPSKVFSFNYVIEKSSGSEHIFKIHFRDEIFWLKITSVEDSYGSERPDLVSVEEVKPVTKQITEFTNV